MGFIRYTRVDDRTVDVSLARLWWLRPSFWRWYRGGGAA